MSVYGCFNRPRPVPNGTYKAQAGWKVWQGNRKPVYVDIRSPFDLAECAYDKRASDHECIGCKHSKAKS